ncbi:high-affinity potassium uptake transporter [Scheffersomyces coipomensis]|uniref:high-affinity potassium uptake transporter n=1 Tax=Scheffersomyces coipomensis TaxID=1788519 RepID=UPI00315D1002
MPPSTTSTNTNPVRRILRSIEERRLELQIGLRIRNKIHKLTNFLYPYVSTLIPNFRIAHYVYIIFLTFLGTFIMFPERNLHYIDILFFSSGAATQAGLNTVDTNLLKLYQQITIYCLTFFATPIFIHGSLLFIRLYYFERHFDNIKEISKQNSKMRRSMTLASIAHSRTHSLALDPTQRNTYNNQGLGYNTATQQGQEQQQHTHDQDLEHDDHHKNKSNHVDVNDKEVDTNSSPPSSTSMPKNANGDVTHMSEPSDSEPDEHVPHPRDHSPSPTPIPILSSQTNDVKFGNLPEPPTKRRNRDIDPSQMYMSIAMLQEKQQQQSQNSINNDNINNTNNYNSAPTNIQFVDLESPQRHRGNNNSPHHGDDDDDDSELIIKSPTEIENSDTSIPIFIKKIKSKHLLRPGGPIRRRSSSSKWGLKSRLRKTFSNTPLASPNPNRKRFIDDEDGDDNDEGDDDNDDDEDEEDEDEEGSIDSENEEEAMTTDVNDDDEGDEAVMDDDDDGDDDDDEENEEHKSGKKHSKTLNTLDISGKNKSSFVKSPTFERMMKMKHAKETRRKKRLNRVKTPYRRNSSLFGGDSTTANNTFTHTSFDDDNTSNEDGDEDEEASYYPGEYDGDNDNSLRKVMSTNYLSWTPTVGRNSTFVKLSEQQKEELGGVEYRAVKLLIKILIYYYVGFHIIAIVCFLPFILNRPGYSAGLREQGISPTWWAFFTAQSTFNDLGITLTNNSMSNFSQSTYVMIISCFFIVIGNTGFPVFLRFLIWILFKFAKPLSTYKESLGFLLDHPRRCFTLLFPSVPTWWLFVILVVLNSVDLVLFIVLDLNNPYLEEIPVGYRVLDGLFQAFSTRTAGFSVVNLAQLHPAVQVSYMIMMYISVLPLAISIRRTNVYEEQSLGVYLKDEKNNAQEDLEKTPTTFVGTHLRNQLSFDLWFIFLGLFIICIAEGGKLNEGNISFTVFTILFEIISAYGTVGLSLGYPGINASLSAEFSTISKLVIIAMMIRGRHRGLPYSLDRAIMLPDQNMKLRDRVQEHHALRRHATMEHANTLGTFNSMGGSMNDNLLRRVVTGTENIFRRRTSLNSAHSSRRNSHTHIRRNQSLSAQSSPPVVPHIHVNSEVIHTHVPSYVIESEHELDNLKPITTS